jgi:alcohol dehydrogenase class IV
MLPTRTFLIPPVLITGTGSSEMVGEEVKKLDLTRGLVVTDEVLSKLGKLEGIKKVLTGSKIQFSIYDKISSEPTVDFVTEGLEAFTDNQCEFCLAVGGGSAIDTAKAISVMATNKGSIEDYKGINNIPQKGAPLIAVPTTAGTGSEVTDHYYRYQDRCKNAPDQSISYTSGCHC